LGYSDGTSFAVRGSGFGSFWEPEGREYSHVKARRQSAIRALVEREAVRSQEQLRRRLRAAGFDVTQATLSRDIREIGLVKGGADGVYRAPAPEPPNGRTARVMLYRAASEYLTRIDRVQQLVLLRTGPGQAQLLGVALDRAGLPEVVGTIAGDDTILAIAPDVRRARALVEHLEHMSKS
jgi:transcriptional regulator of arginine metabolism